MTIEMTGGEAIARMFAAYNAGPIFGMGGFQTLPFYDATRRLGMKHFLINDERAAVFIADAYSKASGGRVTEKGPAKIPKDALTLPGLDGDGPPDLSDFLGRG